MSPAANGKKDTCQSELSLKMNKHMGRNYIIDKNDIQGILVQIHIYIQMKLDTERRQDYKY